MIVVADGYFVGAHARRTHHHVQSFRNGVFGHGDEYRVEIRAEAVEVERRDIVLTCRLRSRGVGPVGVHVEAQPVHLPSGRKNLVYFFLVVFQTRLYIVVAPFGALFVEPWAVGLAETVQIHYVAVGILEVASVDV